MSKPSPARSINVGALLVAAAGVFIIFVSAPDLFPAVPPGVLILAAAAAIVAFVPGRGTPIVGVLLPVVITIGGVANGTSIDILQGDENAGAILGTVIQYPALITATTAGTLAMVSDRSSPPSAAQDAR